jgi:hypothetical protein
MWLQGARLLRSKCRFDDPLCPAGRAHCAWGGHCMAFLLLWGNHCSLALPLAGREGGCAGIQWRG